MNLREELLDEKVWNENKFMIVYNGNYLKFTQNKKASVQ